VRTSDENPALVAEIHSFSAVALDSFVFLNQQHLWFKMRLYEFSVRWHEVTALYGHHFEVHNSPFAFQMARKPAKLNSFGECGHLTYRNEVCVLFTCFIFRQAFNIQTSC